METKFQKLVDSRQSALSDAETAGRAVAHAHPEVQHAVLAQLFVPTLTGAQYNAFLRGLRSIAPK